MIIALCAVALASGDEAIAFYERYRKDRGSEDPNRLLLCDARLVALYETAGNAAKVAQSTDATLRDWASIEAAGRTGELPADGRRAAGATAVRRVEAAFEALAARISAATDLAALEPAIVAFHGDHDPERYGDFEYPRASPTAGSRPQAAGAACASTGATPSTGDSQQRAMRSSRSSSARGSSGRGRRG